MIDWSQITTALLDMDGTLLDLHYDNYFWLQHLPKRYASIHDIPEQEATRRLHLLFNKDRGKLNWYCIDYWSDQLDVDIVSLKSEVTDRIAFLPHAVQLLGSLQTQGIDTIIVTNAHRKTVEIKEKCIPISSYVDQLWSSHDFGYAKEDKRFWPAFAEQNPFDPASTFFIDDSEAVLHCAAHYGIQHLVQPLKPDSTKETHSDRGTNEKLAMPFKTVHSLAELIE